MKRSFLCLLIALSTLAGSSQNNPEKVFDVLHYCLPNHVPDSVLCGRYTVFENRETQKGRKIELNVIVVPAIHRDSAGTPIFYLEGGPGVAASNIASFYAERSNPYRQYHDIVLVDARGTGNSNPLNCPSLQIKKSLKDQFEEMYPKKEVKECYESLSKRADLKQYTTTNVVRDIEDVRKWLGYGKINIYGLSYGTRVALVYMKMFPSSVASCILWSALPTYAKMPLYHAQFAQNTLNKIFDDCMHDSVCRTHFAEIKKEFRLLMEKRKKTPFSVSVVNDSGLPEQVSFSWNAFQTKLRTLMYSPSGIRQIPHIVHEAYMDNLNPFMALYHKGPDTNNLIAEGFYLCVTCAEDVPFIDQKKVKPLTEGTFMGAYRIDQQKSACAQWTRGKVPEDFFDPVNSNIPTLILSGSYDPITPPSMAKEIASHLSNARLVIMPEMSHTFDGLSHIECFDDLCVRFIDKPAVTNLDIGCVAEMKPEEYRTK